MKKIINILAWCLFVLISIGITHQWNEVTMYLLFIIALILGLVSCPLIRIHKNTRCVVRCVRNRCNFPDCLLCHKGTQLKLRYPQF